jgi:hypothetical protein
LKRTLLTLALALLCPLFVSAQTYFRIQGNVTTPLGAAVPGANVAICSQPATVTTQPCTPLASLYAASSSNSTTLTGASYAAQQITFTFASVPSDVVAGSYVAISSVSPSTYNGIWLVASVNGSQVVIANVFTNPGAYSSGGAVQTSALPNPLQTDGNGYYFAYVPSAPYTVQVFSSQIVTQFYRDQYPAGASSGGAGNPASPGLAIQIANLGVTNFQTIQCNGKYFSVDSGTSPTTIDNPCNEAVAGPRPRIDVTWYNADPTGVLDSTIPIQLSITTACSVGGDVFFPAGTYKVSQPQLPSTSAVFPGSSSCRYLHLLGAASKPTSPAQFERAPATRIAVSAGANPNNAAVFSFGNINGGASGNNGILIENLSISGYNQAININGGSGYTLDNDMLGVATTGQAGNTPLSLTDTFEIYRTGGGDQSSTGVPAEIWTAGPNYGVVGIVNYRNLLITSGLGIEYIQANASIGPVAGDWSLENIIMENATNDFLTITNTSGSPMFIGGLYFNHVQTADSPNTQALINFDGGNGGDVLGGVILEQSVAGSGGVAIKKTGLGILENYRTDTALGSGTQQVVDSNGNPVGTGQIQDFGGGYDFMSQFTTGQSAGPSNIAFFPNENYTGSRWFSAGSLHSLLGADSKYGILFSSGLSTGYSTSLAQNSQSTLDVQFAKMVPPTSVSGSATTGGSIPNGTYYVYVSSTSDSCTTQSASSLPSSAVVLSGSNNAIAASWTLPITTPTSPDGYCVAYSTSLNGVPAGGAIFVSGGSTTSYTITAAGSAGTLYPYNIMGARSRFTYNALGIGTTSPAANSITLGVNGIRGILTHANSIDQTWTFPNLSGTVTLDDGTLASAPIGTFPCVSSGVLTVSGCPANFVVTNPSAAAVNLITPTDLTVPNLTFQLIASQTQPFWVAWNAGKTQQMAYLDNGGNLGVQSLSVNGAATVAGNLTVNGFFSLPSEAACYNPAGTVLLQYDPLNVSGKGPFPCISNNRLNAVVETPGAANGPNVIQPGDTTVSNLVLQDVASQTLPLLQFLNSSGGVLGYIDFAGNAFFNSLTITNSSAASTFQQAAPPSGSANTGFSFVGVTASGKRWYTKDDAGVEIDYVGAATTDTFTNKTFNTAATGNVLDINGIGITGVIGNTAKVQLGGTNSGTTGAPLCNDANSNATTTCSIPTETTKSQSSLALTSTGQQVVTILTPSANGLYRVGVVAAVTTAPSACSTNAVYTPLLTWKDGITGTVQTFAGASVTVTGPAGQGSNGAASTMIYAASGTPIAAGINVTTAAATCTTYPLVGTEMEAMP